MDSPYYKMSKLSGTVPRKAFCSLYSLKGMCSEKWRKLPKTSFKGSLCSVQLVEEENIPAFTSASLAHFLLEEWVAREEMSCGRRLHLCISSRLAASDGTTHAAAEAPRAEGKKIWGGWGFLGAAVFFRLTRVCLKQTALAYFGRSALHSVTSTQVHSWSDC